VGQRVSPANLAKSLGKSRVLHFRDAEACLGLSRAIRLRQHGFGHDGASRSAAKVAANMEALGPNPEVMFGSVVEG
jgi:hypothetical protein